MLNVPTIDWIWYFPTIKLHPKRRYNAKNRHPGHLRPTHVCFATCCLVRAAASLEVSAPSGPDGPAGVTVNDVITSRRDGDGGGGGGAVGRESHR